MTGPARGTGLLVVLLAVLAAGFGFASGVASVLLHEKSWPWLALAVAAPAATAAALPAGWVRSGFGLGWLTLVLVVLQGRPEGDFAVLSSPRGYTLLGFCLLFLVGLVVTLPVRRRLGESGTGSPGI